MRFKNFDEVTIYQKVTALILLSGFIFIGLCAAIYYYTIEQEREVYANSRRQFSNEVDAVWKLCAKTNIANITDIAYWDESINYIRHGNAHWLDENITSMLGTYDTDYIGIYDVDGNFINKSSTKKIRTNDFLPDTIFRILEKQRMMQFYMKIPEGYAQVFGASVHPTQDIYDRKTPAEGYIFYVRLIDESYFNAIELVNQSQIGFYDGSVEEVDRSIKIVRELNDWNGETVRKIEFVRPFDVSFHITQHILMILIATYVIGIVIYLVYSRKWIYRPLNLITRILENENESDMNRLKDIPGEFRYIGKLLKEKKEHQNDLETAKAKAEESDRLKSSFLTNISHEIRTPMNAISGFSDLLMNPSLQDSERKEYINIINKSGKNLISIIDDLIKMSKIDTNQEVPNFSVVNIDACIEELFKSIKISIPPQKPIDFKIKKPKNPIFDNIVTDVVKLKQILTNLINNAIKYTEKGYVEIGYEYDEESEQLQFFIEDSGIGIDDQHHQKIFDRFHRIENDMTIKAGGLGLGLAISKAYVKMLGGTISFQSRPAEGSIFSFSLPVTYSNKNQVITLVPSFGSQEDTKSITILVAEDDNINFLLIQKMLNMHKHKVIRAKDGREAVEICLATNNIDLVLMDIKMPVLDGYQAFEQISRVKPDLPVIAQTAYASVEDEKRIKSLGFTGFISKPINKEKLFEIIDEITKSKYSA